MTRRLKDDAPSRSSTEVGRGDYVKIGQTWMKIESNSGQSPADVGSFRTPRSWSVKAENGQTYGMWDINRYAKSGDIEDK